jgi:hypothetical protein
MKEDQVKLKWKGVAFASLMILVLVCSLALPAIAYSPYPMQTTDTQVSDALDYLRGEQTTDGDIGGFGPSAWVVMAVVAAGEDPRDWRLDAASPSIVDYLEGNAASAALVTDYERMIMAIAAAGEDPSDFGGVDFLGLVEGAYDGTQIGDNTLLNDDYWGVVCLTAAGVSQNDPIITNTVAFIKDNQNDDGGWSWGVGTGSDVDMTADAIMALVAAGEGETSKMITDGLAYIKSTQMDNGGFESWGATNADTDSRGIMAAVAAGQNPISDAWQSGTGNDPVDDLLKSQQSDGSFHWQSGIPGMSVPQTTAAAIQALLGEPFPVGGLTVSVRIEGETATVFSGDLTVYQSRIVATDSGVIHTLLCPTALGALNKASQIGGFLYTTSDAWGTPYVDSIDGEVASGVASWLYWVDYSSPMVGAGQFHLGETDASDSPHREVLWAYGEFGEPPLRIGSSNDIVSAGEQFTITVTAEGYDPENWQYTGVIDPIEGATIYIDGVAHGELTNASGEVTLSLDVGGTVRISADKEGSVRSENITITLEPEAAPAASESSDFPWVATGVGIGVLLLAIVVIIYFLRRRGRRHDGLDVVTE